MLKVFRFYEYRGLELVRGYLHYVWDKDGRRYVDAHTGHGVAFLGHSNPKVVRALAQQMSQIMTVSPSFKAPIEDETIEVLDKIAPRSSNCVIFQNSGAEAVEVALKMAWAFTGRRRLVAFTGSFHGRTLGALSVTWEPKYRAGFPTLEDVTFIKYNSSPEEIRDVFPRDAAAVIVEPIQGEGGLSVGSRPFLKSIEEMARETGALLIVDEIQCGFGRAGVNWVHEELGLKPDVVLAGKAIGGGFPVSLVFTREDVASSLLDGRHGSTYASNPMALAAVKASVEVYLEESVPEKVSSVSGRLWSRLESRVRGLGPVRGLRGRGLMVGVELRYPPAKVMRCLQERGVLSLRAGASVLRLLPPYTIDAETVDEVVDKIAECVCAEHGC
ncbi:MAG: aspartate aminotransferase family protein [Fervidicoccaceae archaeon]